MADLEYESYIRTPFSVRAIQITADNIDAVGKMIGEVKRFPNGEKYIVPNWELIPRIRRAKIGWWVTVYADQYRCYAPSVFRQQFVAIPGREVTFEIPPPEEEAPGRVIPAPVSATPDTVVEPAPVSAGPDMVVLGEAD